MCCIYFTNPPSVVPGGKTYCPRRRSSAFFRLPWTSCGTNTAGYVSRQQLWLTNFVWTLEKQSGYSCFCLDKRPDVFGAARYRSQVENPETQYCYLNSSTSDKLFNTFASRRTDDKDQHYWATGGRNRFWTSVQTKDQSRWRVIYQEWTAATRRRSW